MILAADRCRDRAPSFYVADSLGEVAGILNPKLGDVAILAVPGAFNIWRLEDSSSTPDGFNAIASNACEYAWVLSGASGGASGFITPQLFGAVANGITDDTVSVQLALDAATASGGIVYFPAGRYLVTNLVVLSDVTLLGAGPSASVLVQSSTASHCLSINQYGGSTSIPLADNVHDVRVYALGFEGRSVQDGFSQFKHLLTISAVTRATIAFCRFEAAQGDHIYIGAGDVFGVEKHNQEVTVHHCSIDGVNKENRQGISVSDCNGCWLYNNYITRVARSNMPGGIDIEPDSAFNVLTNIWVEDNELVDIGGNAAALNFYTGVLLTTPYDSIHFVANSVKGCRANGIAVIDEAQAVSANTPRAIFVTGNSLDGAYPATTAASPILLRGIRGARILGNTMQNFASAILAGGSTAALGILDCDFVSNTLFKVGWFDGSGFDISFARCRISGNTLDSCGFRSGGGVPGGGNIFHFTAATTSADIELTSNLLIAGDNVTVYGIKKEASHALGGWNIKRDNRVIGVTGDDFIAASAGEEPIGFGVQIASSATDKLSVLQQSTTASTTAAFFSHTGAQSGNGYGIYASKSGAGAVNIAGLFSATGGVTSNIAIRAADGDVEFTSKAVFDATATAGFTRLLIWDVDTAVLQRVKAGANGTGPGGVGRALYIDNV